MSSKDRIVAGSVDLLTPPQRAWVTALRSGEYTQGRGRLTTVNAAGTEEDCCLGVACKEAIKAGVDLKVECFEGGPDCFARVGYNGDKAVLPNAVRTHLGLATNAGAFNHGHDQLAARNDAGATFAQIADLIESRPPGLFVERDS